MPLSRSRKNDHEVLDAIPKLAMPSTPAKGNGNGNSTHTTPSTNNIARFKAKN